MNSLKQKLENEKEREILHKELQNKDLDLLKHDLEFYKNKLTELESENKKLNSSLINSAITSPVKIAANMSSLKHNKYSTQVYNEL